MYVYICMYVCIGGPWCPFFLLTRKKGNHHVSKEVTKIRELNFE